MHISFNAEQTKSGRLFQRKIQWNIFSGWWSIISVASNTAGWCQILQTTELRNQELRRVETFRSHIHDIPRILWPISKYQVMIRSKKLQGFPFRVSGVGPGAMDASIEGFVKALGGGVGAVSRRLVRAWCNAHGETGMAGEFRRVQCWGRLPVASNGIW